MCCAFRRRGSYFKRITIWAYVFDAAVSCVCINAGRFPRLLVIPVFPGLLHVMRSNKELCSICLDMQCSIKVHLRIDLGPAPPFKTVSADSLCTRIIRSSLINNVEDPRQEKTISLHVPGDSKHPIFISQWVSILRSDGVRNLFLLLMMVWHSTPQRQFNRVRYVAIQSFS